MILKLYIPWSVYIYIPWSVYIYIPWSVIFRGVCIMKLRSQKYMTVDPENMTISTVIR